MFDYINYEMDCPNCGEKVKGFQSKDGGCHLDTLEFWQVDDFYSSCKKCDTWIEFTIKEKPIRPIDAYEMYVRTPNKARENE